MKHIDVCVCTYKRPELLSKMLDSLEGQQTNGLFSFSVVVADNDRQETARSVVSGFLRQSRLDVTYCVETRKNIALARNRAIENTKGDYIAFIDDDEHAVANWLYSLYTALESSDAGGALGPVLPYFEIMPPKWAIEGRFFDRPRHHTGFKIDLNEARTGNVLLHRRLVDDEETVFREEFGSGGEDVDFFRRMMQKGEFFIWCDEAVAFEAVPLARCNRNYLIKRALLRGANSYLHRESRVLNVLKSFIAIPIYSMALPCLFPLNRSHYFKYVIKLCDHVGRILAVFGLQLVKERDI